MFGETMFQPTEDGTQRTRQVSCCAPTPRTWRRYDAFAPLLQPYVTGTSVLGVKYSGGVMIAADTLASYGSMARFKDVERMAKVGDCTLLAAGGEISDFQHIQDMLGNLTTRDYCVDDGCKLLPGEVHTYLTRVMYQRRNKMNPLWNSLVVAGFKDGESYLGTVDSIATSYTDDHIATGYGEYLARPLMRSRFNPNMSEGDARALLEDWWVPAICFALLPALC